MARAPVVISVGLVMSAMRQIPGELLHAANRREGPRTDMTYATAGDDPCAGRSKPPTEAALAR